MRKSLATIQVRTLKEYSVSSRICVTQYSEVHNKVETSAMSDSGHKTILSIPFFLIYCIAGFFADIKIGGNRKFFH